MSEKTCISCQQNIKNNDVFCIHCGVNQPEAMTCPSCNSSIKENVKFCENCGYQLNLQKTRRKFHIALTIFLTIIVISIALRIHIVRVMLLFVPVFIVWAVHSMLKRNQR